MGDRCMGTWSIVLADLLCVGLMIHIDPCFVHYRLNFIGCAV